MSRFFHGSESSSESSEEEESLYGSGDEAAAKSEDESSSEEESEEGSDSDSDSSEEGGRTGASRFLRDESDESESEDEDRVTVVKSAKDKRFDELEAIIKQIENAEKINDWGVISECEWQFTRFVSWNMY